MGEKGVHFSYPCLSQRGTVVIDTSTLKSARSRSTSMASVRSHSASTPLRRALRSASKSFGSLPPRGFGGGSLTAAAASLDESQWARPSRTGALHVERALSLPVRSRHSLAQILR